MFEMFDSKTLIIIAVAVFVIMRLRSVLGTRTGYQAPPVDREEMKRLRDAANENQAENQADNTADNVVPLPTRKSAGKSETAKRVKAAVDPITKSINEYAKSGTKLNKGLKLVAATSAEFEPNNFVDGARMAYEMIVTAFADGDKKALKGLLSKEVYEGFAGVITQREKAGHKVHSTFIGIEKSNIKAANVENNEALVTVQFISQIVSATLDKNDELIEGDSEEIVEVNDIWTFARETRSKDPNWKLVATESDT